VAERRCELARSRPPLPPDAYTSHGLVVAASRNDRQHVVNARRAAEACGLHSVPLARSVSPVRSACVRDARNWQRAGSSRGAGRDPYSCSRRRVIRARLRGLPVRQGHAEQQPRRRSGGSFTCADDSLPARSGGGPAKPRARARVS
jgi:hypothetical protein